MSWIKGNLALFLSERPLTSAYLGEKGAKSNFQLII
jgi:hypothetical protein